MPMTEDTVLSDACAPRDGNSKNLTTNTYWTQLDVGEELFAKSQDQHLVAGSSHRTMIR